MAAFPQAAILRVAALRGADAPPLHILDVGANPIEGEVSYQGILGMGLARVTGFEPQPEALAQLMAAKGPTETYLPDALGDGGEAVLHITRQSGFTSIHGADPATAALLGWTRPMRALESIRIPTRRLDDIGLLAPVDFLKIDVQGSELAIISNGRIVLSHAVAIQTEVRLLPIYANEPSFGSLDAELSAQGFRFHDFLHLKRVGLAGSRAARLRRRAFRQVVDGDAIYLRALTAPERMDDDALLRLAILALGVFDSPTVVVYCLDLLVARGRIDNADADAILGLLPAEYLAEPVA